jgi:hypothetical protein
VKLFSPSVIDELRSYRCSCGSGCDPRSVLMAFLVDKAVVLVFLRQLFSIFTVILPVFHTHIFHLSCVILTVDTVSLSLWIRQYSACSGLKILFLYFIYLFHCSFCRCSIWSYIRLHIFTYFMYGLFSSYSAFIITVMLTMQLYDYSRVNSTKSPASGAANVSEPRLMSRDGRVREVVCA